MRFLSLLIVIATASSGGVLRAQTGPLFLATESNSGLVRLVDASTSTTVVVGDTQISGVTFSPNGNAFDGQSGRFYFASIAGSTTTLFFVDALDGARQSAGTLVGRATNASFYNGSYYYVDSGTDDLRRVDLDANGVLISDSLEGNLVGSQYGWGFGDIAIRPDGLLALHGGRTDTTQKVLFLYDLVGGNRLGELPTTVTLQIAFAASGALYGCDTSHTLYTVDLTNGSATAIGTMALPNSLSDLAACSSAPWPATLARCTHRNGSGANPVACSCASLPVLGSNWSVDVAFGPDTVLSLAFAAVAASPPTPLSIGELLIVPPVVSIPANGAGTTPIPSNLALLGSTLFVQGVRLDAVGAGLVIQLTDAQDAQLGL